MANKVSRLALLGGTLFMFACSASTAQTDRARVSALPPKADMPDPLSMLDGTRVHSRSAWIDKRRPELKRLFQEYMYGFVPPKPNRAEAKVLGEYDDFLDGKARLKLVRLEFSFGGSRQKAGGNPLASDPLNIDLMLVLPKQQKRAPLFLTMDFCGNHAITSDSRVPLSKCWMGKSCAGCTNNAATEAARGSQATNWPLGEIVGRGYGLAAFYSGDVDPDRADASTGIYARLANGDSALNNPTNRGTIAAWAWGFERCVDYLMTDSAIDHHRIAALGHSRNGKTALLAAAFDERISIAFPHQAGCGGSAPSRSNVGESVKAINDRFPHWFNGKFKEFNEHPENLPFDQDCLVALCAPRPVLLTAATGDQWSNPAGQFEVLKAAEPVYTFLGAEGFGQPNMPPIDHLVGKRLGYYIREGKHSMTPADWKVFMDFADKQWRSGHSAGEK
jgi:(4-O-methyl)-D-glucuronate---lignin esterase